MRLFDDAVVIFGFAGNLPVRSRARVLMLVAAQLWLTASLGAAPVKMQFLATVDTVFSGIPFESGIMFDVGDVVSGEFQFNPSFSDGSETVTLQQPYVFRLIVNGAELASLGFQISAANDTPIFDFDAANILDSLSMVGSPLAGSSPTAIDPMTSNFRMFLWEGASWPDNVEVLGVAHIPGDAETWNQFRSWRSLQVYLADGSGSSMGFAATVGQFFSVPEPDASALALLVFVTVTPCGLVRHRAGHRCSLLAVVLPSEVYWLEFPERSAVEKRGLRTMRQEFRGKHC